MIVLSRMCHPIVRTVLLSRVKNISRLNNCFNKPDVFYRGFRYKLPFKNTRKDTPVKLIEEFPRENNVWSGLVKSFIFTTGFCASVFIGAMVYQYEYVTKRFSKDDVFEWAHDQWYGLEGKLSKEGSMRRYINMWWNEQSEGNKVFWSIFLLNSMVLTCWQIPRYHNTMFQYFCHSPTARAVCWPLLLSSFSHVSMLHFAMNMYVLQSFSSLSCYALDKEQFLAMYLCGGVVSSLAGSTYKVLTRCARPSMGASGAIMAVLGFFCITYPDKQVGIFFIPNCSIDSITAIKGIMCMDLAGLVFKWSMFDHAAHLGGAVVGILYAMYGDRVWMKREPIIKNWCTFKMYWKGQKDE